MTPGWRVRTAESMEQDGYDVFIMEKGDTFTRHVSRMDFDTQPRYGARVQPVHLPREALQAFMDGLWHDGFRPTGVTETRETMVATVRHLNDMRAIASKKIGVVLP